MTPPPGEKGALLPREGLVRGDVGESGLEVLLAASGLAPKWPTVPADTRRGVAKQRYGWS